MRYKWKPNSNQRAEYAAKCRAIEAAKSADLSDRDIVYRIDCTGDCCTGDEIIFFNPAKSAEKIYGRIIKDSYGSDKQQHTFTIETDGYEGIMLIKGRNLYKNGVKRKEWPEESKRAEIIEEKHNRGNIARAARDKRKEEKENRMLYNIPSWALEYGDVNPY